VNLPVNAYFRRDERRLRPSPTEERSLRSGLVAVSPSYFEAVTSSALMKSG
jgi:hypothetical protein